MRCNQNDRENGGRVSCSSGKTSSGSILVQNAQVPNDRRDDVDDSESKERENKDKRKKEEMEMTNGEKKERNESK